MPHKNPMMKAAQTSVDIYLFSRKRLIIARSKSLSTSITSSSKIYSLMYQLYTKTTTKSKRAV